METILNEEQRLAVTTTEGFVRVIAGAGSGKTRALAHRYAFLVNDLGILPENILCVTFTNKAAAEMRRRVRRLIGDNDTAYINTFHGFCVSVLQEDSHAAGYPKSFLVLDNSDIDAMLKIIYEERGLTLRDKTFSDARDMIEIQKLFRHPDYTADMIDGTPETLRKKYLLASGTDDIIFYGYLYQERKCFGLDYNDLIKFTLRIFDRHPEIKLKWQSRLEYVMIDEFQDIDFLQYELMEVLCGHHKNLFVVGDPDQTIYTWRGANVRYLLDFDKRFPGTRTVVMPKNYRSTPQILDAANSLIAKNSERYAKDLVPVRENGSPMRFCFAANAEAESARIAKEIQELHAGGLPYGSIAVLYRAHYVSRALEESFLLNKLPYRIYSGVQFFERAEIKDALCWLRMVFAGDDMSFRRIVNQPKRNMGRRRMEFLEKQAAAHGCTLYQALKLNLADDIFKGTKAAEFVALIERFSADCEKRAVSDLLEDILDKSGYEAMRRLEGSGERLDNLAELKQSVRDYELSCGEEATLAHYLAHVALFTNADAEDKADKVRLMTVHAAKGLEFPVVFLCGMNEGVFPSRKVRDLRGMEEERRLAFVAMTRARDMLTLSGAAGRNFDGSVRYPSRFVLDIDRQLIGYDGVDEDLLAEAKAHVLYAESLLAGNDAPPCPAGSRVRHPHFGEGTVLAVDAGKKACSVLFDSAETARLISFRTKMTVLSQPCGQDEHRRSWRER